MSLVTRHAPSLFSSERREYRLTYALSFPLFFAVALMSRFLPASMRPLPFERGRFFAVMADARQTAHSVLPYAFMR
ncbi:hypothetical protein U0C82_04850 [Fulvimarina sp. 2208YS6-2-32]|uniref:Uncharacterized protein n=1 Tax=Fulvimarina uroteuthidis TaxID=3098149 RepID=A0ABU5HZC8_9HYPH|nr:hypothetical protein [Fulvimarina sp. 2208YS6-2-32]MDY8108481.1 hypothetical protein [Fulvimarina sp. 2208YS6-2-32]